MNLREAESNYANAKAQDTGSINSARELRFAARALTEATNQLVMDRLSGLQRFSDDMGKRIQAQTL